VSKRSRHIPNKVKLAAALLLHMRDDGTGRLVRTISHAEARTLTGWWTSRAMEHQPQAGSGAQAQDSQG
jgi:hypothetical protein